MGQETVDSTTDHRDLRGGLARGTCQRMATSLALPLALMAMLALAPAASAEASSSPAWELIAEHGPTNVPVTTPVPQEWRVEVSGVNGRTPNEGRFRLLLELHEREIKTKPIRFDATAAEVQQALEANRRIGRGNVTVSGGPLGKGENVWSYAIAIDGALLGENVELEAEEIEPRAREEKALITAGQEPEAASYESEEAHEAEHDTITYILTPINVGGAPTVSGQPITVKDVLPDGVTVDEVRPYNEVETPAEDWKCTPEGEAAVGAQSVQCTTTQPVNPDAPATGSNTANAITIVAAVDPGKAREDEQTGTPLINRVVLEGGGAQSVTVTDEAPVSETPAPFGIHTPRARSTGNAGETYTLAGGHPYAASTSFFLNTESRFNRSIGETEIFTHGNPKDVNVQLPEGFIANPQALPRCTQIEFTEGLRGGSNPSVGGCRPETQVGVALLYLGSYGSPPVRQPVYNLAPPPGVPAELGLSFENIVPLRLDAHLVRVHGVYQLTILSPDINQALNFNGIWLTLWGAPADESHYPERSQKEDHTKRGAPGGEALGPFLSTPTDCLAEAAQQPATIIRYDQWENPVAEGDAEGTLSDPRWLQASAAAPAVTGCQELRFEPKASFAQRTETGEGALSGTRRAAAPSGYELVLEIPQDESPGGRATPQLKSTTVSLPAGVVLSPSVANGLVACDESQLEPESGTRGSCPQASQVGRVRIATPLLAEELSGRLYLGRPECEPCDAADAEGGRMLKLFIEAEGSGVRIKLVGQATLDAATGRLNTTFPYNPQTPLKRLTLTLKGGPGASLANPKTCGSYAAEALLTPWSLAGTLPSGEEVLGGSAALVLATPLTVDWDGAGGACPDALPFAPTLSAGTESATAGSYSPFETLLRRTDDREQDLAKVDLHLPSGLIGKIAGIARCTEPAAGAGQCPESSRIGTATALAGSGSQPFVSRGPVYLTDSYNGAPFGLSIAVPAKAGPLDLGTVVVRASVGIDPRTLALTVTSDPLPQSVAGVPLRLKALDVKLDRPEFMLNPTSCVSSQIDATLTGMPVTAGEPAFTAGARAPFSASGCAALGFDPKVSMSTQAHWSKEGGANLQVKLTASRGQANVRRFELELPEALPTRLDTLQKACTEKQFGANPAGCPEASVVGSASARTPLLSTPLTGPAYLVSHGGAAFPDLVFLLQGEGIHLELVGNTDIKKVTGADGTAREVTFSRFQSVPDAPIDSFEANLPAGPHSILTGYGNLCEGELLAPTTLLAQNDARLQTTTRIEVAGCPPSLAVTRTRVSGNSLLVTLKLGQAGRVRISGAGVRTTTRTLPAGVQTVKVGLSKAGRAARHKHRKIRLLATLTAGGQTGMRSATVKT